VSGEPVTHAKICRVCKQDCSTRPRQKDKDGSYTCQACLDKSGKGRAPGSEQVAIDPGLAAALKGVDQAAMTACPNCGVLLKPSAVLCTGCGFDVEKGRALRTRVSIEKGGGGDKGPNAQRNKNIVVGIVAVLILAGAAVVILNQMGVL